MAPDALVAPDQSTAHHILVQQGPFACRKESSRRDFGESIGTRDFSCPRTTAGQKINRLIELILQLRVCLIAVLLLFFFLGFLHRRRLLLLVLFVLRKGLLVAPLVGRGLLLVRGLVVLCDENPDGQSLVTSQGVY